MVQANTGNGLSIGDLRHRHLQRKSLVTLLLIFGALFSATMTAWVYGQDIEPVHANPGAAGLAFPRDSATGRIVTDLPDSARGVPANLERQQPGGRAVQLPTATVAAGSDDRASNTPVIMREWLPFLQAATLALIVFAVLLLGIGIRWELHSHLHSP